MKKVTLKALRQSIAHWERLRDNKERVQEDGTLEGPCGTSCALCQRFTSENRGDYCVRIFARSLAEACPVKAKTGRDNCEGSPWREAALAYGTSDSPGRTDIINREIVFLKSLIPEEEKK